MSTMAKNEETTIAFNRKIWKILHHGMITKTIGVGCRLGLFDLLAEADAPLTSQEIADKMKFKERYVREWLGVMACCGIIEVQDSKFRLPPHRRDVMIGVTPLNAGNFSWGIHVLTQVADDLAECFKLDGPIGLPYSKYPSFQEWRGYSMSKTFTWEMFKQRLSEVPGVIQKLERGIEMCELGCGTGHVTFLLAKHFPNSTIYGLDISEEAITTAKRKAGDMGIHNVKFLVEDCCNLPEEWTDKWEYMLSFLLVHDLPQPLKGLKEMCRVLKPGCVVSNMEYMLHSNLEDNLSNLTAALLYGISLFHCMPVSLAAGGEGNGTGWGKERTMEAMKQAGFTSVQAVQFNHAGLYVHYLCRAGPSPGQRKEPLLAPRL